MKQEKTFSGQCDTPRRGSAAQKGNAASHGVAIAPHGESAASADEAAALNGESAALAAWWAKYASVENAIVSAQERRRRRAKARRRSRAREFGDICEMSDGLAVRWRRDGFFEGEEFALMVLRDAGYYAYLDFMRRESGRNVSRLKQSLRQRLLWVPMALRWTGCALLIIAMIEGLFSAAFSLRLTKKENRGDLICNSVRSLPASRSLP